MEVTMKMHYSNAHLKLILASLLAASGAMGAAGLAMATDPTSEIRESTDPGKVADVESRARELQARQQMGVTGTSGTSGTSGMSSGSSDSGAAGGTERKRHAKGKKHHGKHGGHRSSGDTDTGSNSK
jgi:hypothetical protein